VARAATWRLRYSDVWNGTPSKGWTCHLAMLNCGVQWVWLSDFWYIYLKLRKFKIYKQETF